VFQRELVIRQSLEHVDREDRVGHPLFAHGFHRVLVLDIEPQNLDIGIRLKAPAEIISQVPN
jgi:hypothetical protein